MIGLIVRKKQQNSIGGAKAVGADWYKPRVSGAIFIVIGAFILLWIRLLYLQVIEGDSYRRLSETNSIRLQKITPTRGLIFDRDGHLYVDNRPAFELSIILKDAKPVDQTIASLAKCLGIPPRQLFDTIDRQKGQPSYKPILLMNDIGRDSLAAVEVHRYELPGVIVNAKPIRHYIEGARASHLIGYMSEISSNELTMKKNEGYDPGDYIGKYGVEKAAEPYLRGERGGRQVEVNVRGQVVRILNSVPGRPGNSVFLTVSDKLQTTAETLLTDKKGAIVAMDPNNGELLAFASSPDFDPNIFVGGMTRDQWQTLSSNPAKPLASKVIQSEYPPASVYKIVLSLAGIEEGIINNSMSVVCPGFFQFGNRSYRCWKKQGHGRVGFYQALASSCDVFYYQVGLQLGVDRLAWYARACGLGGPTGINIDNESTGLIPTAAWKQARFGEAWYRGETVSISIGQGYNLVTPLQLCVLIAAVANGGIRYEPQMIKSVQTTEGETVFRAEPKVMGRLPVSSATIDKVQKALREVVAGPTGTARIALIDGLAISGKTGTAQVFSRNSNDTKPKKNTPENLKDHAWFVAYAPSEAPRIAVAVLVEHGEHGASGAAPLARDLIRTYLLGADPDKKVQMAPSTALDPSILD
jgi:penicillin-binding protein 2